MSTMNILTATLVLLIVGAGLAVFFGMRSANAAASVPLVAPTAVSAVTAPDAMDDISEDL